MTVLSILMAWRDARHTRSARWFDSPGLPAPSLDRAVTALTGAVGYAPPARCEVSGHFPRITAFSQAVLLQWSSVRLKLRFDWKRVEDMADVYMDHRSRTSAASRIFFDPSLPEPEASTTPAPGAADSALAQPGTGAAASSGEASPELTAAGGMASGAAGVEASGVVGTAASGPADDAPAASSCPPAGPPGPRSPGAQLLPPLRPQRLRIP